MGLGNNGNGKPRIFCTVKKFVDSAGKDQIKIKSGTKDDPHFFSYADGDLVDIIPFEGEYEGNVTYKIRFILDDGENDIWLEYGRYTGFTRDVLNNLASLDKISRVRFTPFLSEDEKTGKKYVRGAVRVGANYETKVSKKYAWDDPTVPKIKMTTVGKKEYVDSGELDDWTDLLLEEVKAKIVPRTASAQPVAQHVESGNDDEDYPKY